MGGLRRFVRRLVTLVRTTSTDASARREIAAHLALLEDEYLRRGHSADEARRLARLRLGGVEQTMERRREAGSFQWVVDLAGDITHALRGFARSPGFTLACVLTLALGIGVNTALFSAVSATLIRPLPYSSPERLAVLWERDERRGLGQEFVTPGSFADWEVQSPHVFEALGYTPNWPGARSFLVEGSDHNERVAGAFASSGVFRALGVEPRRGRLFTPADDVPNGPPMALVSHEYWRDRLSGAEDVIGKQVAILTQDRRTFTIVGVLPPAFNYPESAQIWLSAGQMGVEIPSPGSVVRGGPWLEVVGRLRQGVTLEHAQTEMAAIARGVRSAHAALAINEQVIVRSLKDHVVGSMRATLLVLFGAVSCVLLIACMNVGNLLMARGVARRHELQLRAALGAGTGRIMRQLLAESATLALAGGVAGVAVGYACLAVVRALGVSQWPQMGDGRIDGTVLLFTAGVSLLAGVGTGLAPALYGRSVNLSIGLREGGRSGAAARRTRLERVFVVSQVALALVLLLTASLFVQSLSRLRRVDPGFRTDNAIAFAIDLSGIRGDDDGSERRVTLREILERVTRLPGVEAVGASSLLPLSQGGWEDRPGGSWSNQSFTFEQHVPPAAVSATADPRVVTPDYFRAMGIPLHAGRMFGEGDDAGRPGVVLVNEAFARRFSPGYPATRALMGHRLVFVRDGAPQMSADTGQPEWREIVGIVGDVRTGGLQTEPRPEIYLPYAQVAWPDVALVVRSAGDPHALGGVVRQEIGAANRSVVVAGVRSLDEVVAASVAEQRFRSVLLASFAGAAVLLAALGVYATMARAVASRTSEIGIRMALGARRSSVLTLVAGEGALLSVVGVAVGLLVALPLQRVSRSLLFGIETVEVVVTLLAAGLLLGVASAASLVPALRATRIDPLTALRND